MMSKKYAWTWIIKEDCIDKYVEMHGNVWESVLQEHTNAGIRNYSIFQNKNQFIYVYECDDIEFTCNYIANSKVCQEWDAITSKMVDGSFNWGDENPVDYLTEVFYLK